MSEYTIPLETILLAGKYGYSLARRNENKAAIKRISPKQLAYIAQLRERHPEVYNDLHQIVSDYHNVLDTADWTSADAMFVIGFMRRL